MTSSPRLKPGDSHLGPHPVLERSRMSYGVSSGRVETSPGQNDSGSVSVAVADQPAGVADELALGQFQPLLNWPTSVRGPHTKWWNGSRRTASLSQSASRRPPRTAGGLGPHQHWSVWQTDSPNRFGWFRGPACQQSSRRVSLSSGALGCSTGDSRIGVLSCLHRYPSVRGRRGAPERISSRFAPVRTRHRSWWGMATVGSHRWQPWPQPAATPTMCLSVSASVRSGYLFFATASSAYRTTTVVWQSSGSQEWSMSQAKFNTRSTACTDSSSRSRDAHRGCCGRSSPLSSLGSRRSGPTPTSWPRSAAPRWRWSSSTSRTSDGCSPDSSPCLKAGASSGFFR